MAHVRFIRVLFIACVCCCAACEKSYNPNTKENISAYRVFDSYFYLADSLGLVKTEFKSDEDIFFNFGVINNRDVKLPYTKGHSGPAVAFVIFQDDTIVGHSDDGYAYLAVITGGVITPWDTLKYSASWYSNPYHENDLLPGDYIAHVQSHMWFDNFDLNSMLVAVPFKIVE